MIESYVVLECFEQSEFYSARNLINLSLVTKIHVLVSLLHNYQIIHLKRVFRLGPLSEEVKPKTETNRTLTRTICTISFISFGTVTTETTIIIIACCILMTLMYRCIQTFIDVYNKNNFQLCNLTQIERKHDIKHSLSK